MDKFIHILLLGEDIGSLMWKKSSGEAYFMYNPEFLRIPIEPFPLAAAKTSDPFRHYKSTEGRMFQHLPSFIADSLPDDWGNELFNQWVAAQKLSHKDITPLDKLSFIGQRGMGALEFVPNLDVPIPNERVNVASLAKLAKKIYDQRENLVILPDESITMQQLLAVGTSAGGRQPKAILAINPETHEIHSGQVDGLENYTYYILKFGDKIRSTAELEMTYHELAVQSGIQMMPSIIWEVEGENHFLTERFDRPNGQKVHVQTLAAMRPEAESYEDLLLVCRELQLPDSASNEVFRRMVFNYLANNTDDHDKNFAFLMNKAGEWSLSPAYDLTYIFNSGGYQPEEEHCLMMRGLRSDWTKEDVLAFAKDNGIAGAERIIQEVADSLTHFRELALKNGVASQWIGRVEDTIHHHLAEWGYLPFQRPSWTTADGHVVDNAYLYQAYKGAIHLYATIDGKQCRHIFNKTGAEALDIEQYSVNNVPEELLHRLTEQYLINVISL